MLISFCKTEGVDRREFDVGSISYNFKIQSLLPFASSPVKAIPALEEKDTVVLPNPYKGTVNPTHGLKNSQMMTCLQPLHLLGALFCLQHPSN